jgi:cytochrome c-type biogenesis protein CcmH
MQAPDTLPRMGAGLVRAVGSQSARNALTALCLCFVLALALPAPAAAREAAPASADPALEARVMRVSSELRCLVCQNETIAGSNAELAVDLRNQVREMLRKGQTEQQVFDYMTARYGDFVLYRPPVKSTTLLLWYGPPLMLGAGLLALWLLLRRRGRLGDDRFEPEETPEEK